MDDLWNERELRAISDDLAQCAHIAHLLSQESSAIAKVGSTVSVKLDEEDIFGEKETILYLRGAEGGLGTDEPAGFSRMNLGSVVRLADLDGMGDAQLVAALQSVAGGAGPAVSVNTLVHALVPSKYVVHVYPVAVLALANTSDGFSRLEELYAEAADVISYAPSGRELARRCADALPVACGDAGGGIVLMQQGILACGETARGCYRRIVELVSLAEDHLSQVLVRPSREPSPSAAAQPSREELASLRQAVSASAGRPMIVTTDAGPRVLRFVQREDVMDLASRGLASPDHARWLGGTPLVVQVSGDVASALASDARPRVVHVPELGMCTLGRTAGDAATAANLYRQTIDVILASEALGGYEPLLVEGVAADVDPAEGESAEASGKLPMFAGEVALVTGAASGIGKACVEAFLERGAAVVGLDINPTVAALCDGPAFLGICCDMTDEDAVCAALDAAVRTFGGIDMLVPNAGIFPKGCPISALSTAEWRKVMAINLDANLILFREAYPLLKRAPRTGRVVVMSSRNVPAPGPGAVAYSASKAALTQLARVAALEWGGDGIRVNMLNPHAVFDTGIWTDEVLQARAAHYGLTVDQYKRNNVLKVEIASRDVAELVAEMCGPLFSKTTGAQVPIDGGSNRVI